MAVDSQRVLQDLILKLVPADGTSIGNLALEKAFQEAAKTELRRLPLGQNYKPLA